jgi:hypothetical protein
MPADRPNIGMGRRRQGDTEPDRPDDSKRALDRAIDDEGIAGDREDHERGRTPGARGVTTPHAPVKPGTRRDLEDSGLTRDDTP